jgi:ATP-dependent Lhr-like helicase
LTGWKIVSDSFRLRFEGEDLTETAVREAVAKLANPAIWDDLQFWQRVIAQVPPYRLSKFQGALPDRYQMEMVGNSLLDLAGTRAYLSASRQWAEAPQQGLLQRVLAELPAANVEALPLARPEREIRRVDDDAQLRALCADLMSRPLIALDVETTLGDFELCLVQVGVPEYSAIIDARAIADLSPLAAVLETTAIAKVIHNAAFEREVFSQLNVSILNVIDTVEVSRRVRGRQPEGHSLAAVCRRELGLRLDKSQQKSDWTQRPLTQAQLDYAALDADVLLRIHAKLATETQTGERELAPPLRR